MKFLCLACDEAMRLASAAGPDEGSLTVTFGCPRCGHQVAMLTNPWETQLVKTLGVKVGARGRRPRRSRRSEPGSRTSDTARLPRPARASPPRRARRGSPPCPPARSRPPKPGRAVPSRR